MVAVSVVIPTYNRANVLPRAIDSVLQQTIDDFEVIVVDDGSTDNTEKVVGEYSDNRVKYISTEDNKGANVARNIGIKQATGEYISFLDSDDIFSNDNLRICLNTLEKTSDIYVGVFTGYHVDVGSMNKFQVASPKVIRTPNELGKKVLNESKSISIGGFSSLMFRRSVFKKIGLLDEDLPSYQDLDFYLRVLQNHYLRGIDEPLYTYVRHEEQISSNSNRRIRGIRNILEKHGQTLPPSVTSYLYFSLGIESMNVDETNISTKSFRKSVEIDKYNLKYWCYYLPSLFGENIFNVAMTVKPYIKKVVHTVRQN